MKDMRVVFSFVSYHFNDGRIGKICRANQTNRSKSGNSNYANRVNQISLYCELSELIINLQGKSDKYYKYTNMYSSNLPDLG